MEVEELVVWRRETEKIVQEQKWWRMRGEFEPNYEEEFQ